ncbi:MutS-related protein [Nonlabens sp. SY33080]|uniref:MutS-related protein n=1 Tax=Nonlabens sp. SY33080 TaxID=2719911 RepID=UPI001428AF8B|nr:DNA mismatch repair protein MutS [Nonlabens sp. SY33080]
MTLDLLNTYKERIEINRGKVEAIKKKLSLSSALRLVLFLSLAVSVYYFWSKIGVLTLILGTGGALFLWLVKNHQNLKNQKDFHQLLIEINEKEILAVQGEFDSFVDGDAYKNPTHDYSHDIDLFGKGSLFQQINRCATKGGEVTLSRKLTHNQPSGVIEKQIAIKELSGKLNFRQNYMATARLISIDRATNFAHWFTNYKPFVPKYYSWGWSIILTVNIVLIALYSFTSLNGYLASIGVVIALLVTRRYLKKVNQVAQVITPLEDFFAQYGKLIALIEKQEFQSSLLLEIQNNLKTQDKKASSVMHDFSQALGRLDQRHNMLFGFIANALGLWDLKQMSYIERWISEYKEKVGTWISMIEEIDAINSMANYAYNNQTFTYPSIKSGPFTLQASKASHPLLNPEKAIGNPISISQGEFFIITGANMAGKSTFLRTVSSLIVMANCGLPVCAHDVVYSPIRLITSMRTTDSIQDDTSYFFGELKRLQYIMNSIEEFPYFIVLDEILKGTNSEDKAIGSQKLVQKLNSLGATGIIATHDLSLTQVANDYPSIKNYYFDAEVVNDELHFDYKCKTGVAHNMNASFLLRKMGIVE